MPSYGGTSGYTTSPFSLMRRMSEDMDRLFDSFGLGRAFGMSPLDERLPSSGANNDLWRGGSSLGQGAWYPQLETFRRGDQLIVRADLPGLKKEDVNVEVDDGILTIYGQRSDEHEDQQDDFYRTERSYGQFYRSLPLPDGVSSDKCEATFNDGVLEVKLAAPKQGEKRPKRIQVR